jgi:hypothetical protein
MEMGQQVPSATPVAIFPTTRRPITAELIRQNGLKFSYNFSPCVIMMNVTVSLLLAFYSLL